MKHDPTEDPYPEREGEHEHQYAAAAEQLRNLPDVPVDFSNALAKHAEAFIDVIVVSTPPGSYNWGMRLGAKQWVLRNDHIDLAATLGPTAVALAGVMTAATAASPVPMAVGLLMSAIGVLRKVDKKTASLSAEHYALLMALKRLGPSKPAALVSALQDIRKWRIGTWTESSVLGMLQALKTVPLRDGGVEAFVTEQKNDAWSVNGV